LSLADDNIDPLDESALRSLRRWRLPTDQLHHKEFTDVLKYIRALQKVAREMKQDIDIFLTKHKDSTEFHREILLGNLEEFYTTLGLAETAYLKLSSGDVRYASGVAKIFARIGNYVGMISFLAGPLEDENGFTTYFELALRGSEAERQRRASLVRATDARRNPVWRDRARTLWGEHPTWTQNRVATEIAASCCADKRSVMRAIKALIPETSPSHPSKRGQ
jgi:hypothetical protein